MHAYVVWNVLSLTTQTAACMMASRLPSGGSRFPDICCVSTIFLNRFPSLVSESTCWKPNAGWHGSFLFGHGRWSFASLVSVYGRRVLSTNEPNPASGKLVNEAVAITIQLWLRCTCLPILALPVILLSSLSKSFPRFFTFIKSSFIE